MRALLRLWAAPPGKRAASSCLKPPGSGAQGNRRPVPHVWRRLVCLVLLDMKKPLGPGQSGFIQSC